ncbi:MAG: TlpA family protein disulfide reductase [Hyphomicrobiales bacterium]|nr:TlpA family protein disulfide reductase [Hyphomicrobiales bacterium]MDE2286145.1 TlpA family protein disulfide reductase [Hyphomicrobiales bacterium]MDE2374946.1 TlpA family protein disulfide reductase [Hyphomicrobiales bacterium]
MTEQSVPPRDKIRRWRLLSAVAAIGIAAGLAGVYGIAHLRSNPDAAACAPAVKIGQHIAPLAQGELAALTVAHTPFRVPNIAFKDAEGHDRSLADWHGRTVLLNLWATWCVPCRREMPALDKLQSELGGTGFEVVAVNINTRDPQKPRAFLKEIGVTHLAYYSDESAKVFQSLKLAGKAFGMPTTLLVGRSGCEIGEMAGPAEWSSPTGVKLVSAAIGAAPNTAREN